MSSKQATKTGGSGGIGLFGCIFIVFLFLKLAEIGTVATWSWWWVCSPLLISGGLILLLLLIFCIVWIGVRVGDKSLKKPKLHSKKHLKAQLDDMYLEFAKHLKQIGELKNQSSDLTVLLQEAVGEKVSLEQKHRVQSLCKRLLAEQKNGHHRKLNDMQRELVRQALNQAELERAMLEDETIANAAYGPFELQGEDLEAVGPEFFGIEDRL